MRWRSFVSAAFRRRSAGRARCFCFASMQNEFSQACLSVGPRSCYGATRPAVFGSPASESRMKFPESAKMWRAFACLSRRLARQCIWVAYVRTPATRCHGALLKAKRSLQALRSTLRCESNTGGSTQISIVGAAVWLPVVERSRYGKRSMRSFEATFVVNE